MFKFTTAEGATDIASWLIAYRETWEEIRGQMSGESPDFEQERIYEYLVTTHHEMIHFWQAISTNFLFFHSQRHLDVCVDLLNAYRDAASTFKHEDFREHFVEMQKHLLEACDGVRCIDIIEGQAVLCSYRMTVPDAAAAGFAAHLERYHSNQPIYTTAYSRAAELVGEAAFELFSPLCFVALQTGHPSNTFRELLVAASLNLHLHKKCSLDIIPQQLRLDPLSFIFGVLTIDASSFLLPSVKSNDPRIAHPILAPYVQEAASSESALDFFARPYELFGIRRPMSRLPRLMAPPVQLHADGRVNIMGLGRSLGMDWALQTFYLTAATGIASHLLFGGTRDMSCPHVNCPQYTRRLCHKFYNFPITDQSQCSFPRFLKEIGLAELLS